jgi:hypothetical protein
MTFPVGHKTDVPLPILAAQAAPDYQHFSEKSGLGRFFYLS